MVIHRAPPILTIQLKRFNVFAQKINKRITIESNIDIAPFMSDRENLPLKYSLYSVIVHEGSSMGSGHYVCYSKAANGMWYLFNDSSVRQVPEQTVLSQSGYILMYELASGTAPENRVWYPSLNPANFDENISEDDSCSTPMGAAPSPPLLVPITTPTGSGVCVINHDDTDDDDDGDDDDDDDSNTTTSNDDNQHLLVSTNNIMAEQHQQQEEETKGSLGKKFTAQQLFIREQMTRAVVGKKTRKVLRALTVMRLINKNARAAKRGLNSLEQLGGPGGLKFQEQLGGPGGLNSQEQLGDEPVDHISSTPIEDSTMDISKPSISNNKWGKISVATWDDDDGVVMRNLVRNMENISEPGERSVHDLEYDEGKSMHNPRSEFSAGKGLPPSLTDDFNYVSQVGPVGYSRGGKGKGKGGFRGGKGKGGFRSGKGKGKGGFRGGKGNGGFRGGKGKGKGGFRGGSGQERS